MNIIIIFSHPSKSDSISSIVLGIQYMGISSIQPAGSIFWMMMSSNWFSIRRVMLGSQRDCSLPVLLLSTRSWHMEKIAFGWAVAVQKACLRWYHGYYNWQHYYLFVRKRWISCRKRFHFLVINSEWGLNLWLFWDFVFQTNSHVVPTGIAQTFCVQYVVVVFLWLTLFKLWLATAECGCGCDLSEEGQGLPF